MKKLTIMAASMLLLLFAGFEPLCAKSVPREPSPADVLSSGTDFPQPLEMRGHRMPLTLIGFSNGRTPDPASIAGQPIPPLPDVWKWNGCAFVWSASRQQWLRLPRNDARVFFIHQAEKGEPGHSWRKQFTGTLVVDGKQPPPMVSGDNVLLAFHGRLPLYSGRPEGRSSFEVTRLYTTQDGYNKRYAYLRRLGGASATFGDNAVPVVAQQMPGKYFVVSVRQRLEPGHYAFYMDRAFEFVVAGQPAPVPAPQSPVPVPVLLNPACPGSLCPPFAQAPVAAPEPPEK